MKLISWNILANEFITQSDYPMIKGKTLFNRNERLKNIMQLLLKANADVMLLQEIMEKEFKALMKLFASKYTIVRGKNINWYNKPSQSCNIILLRKTHFKLLKTYDLEFGLYLVAGTSANEVGAAGTSSNTGTSANEVVIINVHLNDTSHLDRIKQITSIKEILYKSNKVILGGDFNQVYNARSTLYKMISNAGLMPTIHDPTYYVEKKMCIDNLMLKGFQLDNTCPIKKNNELNCCNNKTKNNKTKNNKTKTNKTKNNKTKNNKTKNNKTKNNKTTRNGSCVINKYKSQVENQFNAYGSDHLLIIVNTL
jgi:endonuclease/exonuclease/phosphatase family metal-dependent hydrolase